MKKKRSVWNRPCDSQNIFTAYLSKAVYRKRSEYIYRFERYQRFETQVEETFLVDLCDREELLIEGLPPEMQLEDEVLLSALAMLNVRERAVLFARVLEEKPFRQIAAQLETSTKGAAAIYYRALQKLRKRMGVQGR